jgi:hypothetical protein
VPLKVSTVITVFEAVAGITRVTVGAGYGCVIGTGSSEAHRAVPRSRSSQLLMATSLPAVFIGDVLISYLSFVA